MVLTIAVDELDVVNVAEGQAVNISVDALPDLLLSGAVERIAPVGASSSGVSTYDVKLSFDSAGTGVRPGMNASGEVQVAHADSALYVPVEALMTMGDQKYLLVADGSGTMPENTLPQPNSAGQGGGAARQALAAEDGAAGPSTANADASAGDGAASAADALAPDASGQENFPRGQRNAAAGQGDASFALGDGQNASGFQGAPPDFQGNEGGFPGAPDASALQSGSVTGSLRAVTVGLVNDDYAEILTGVSAGEIVLYQNGDTDSGNPFMMGGGGGMQMPMMGF